MTSAFPRHTHKFYHKRERLSTANSLFATLSPVARITVKGTEEFRPFVGKCLSFFDHISVCRLSGKALALSVKLLRIGKRDRINEYFLFVIDEHHARPGRSERNSE